jgi:hypothetical protein
MNRRFFALFLLLCVTLAVVAAPINVGDDVFLIFDAQGMPLTCTAQILETRAKKAVAKAKAKPVAKPKPVVKVRTEH